MPDYLLLNRCAITIIPKPPFWQWVNQNKEIDEAFIIQQQTDSNIYLIPDYESEEDISSAIANYLLENFDDIFISELEAWNMDPASFPEINHDRFNEWFEVHPHTMIFDTVNRPLKRQ
jgi:hypothetical protein